MKHPVPVVITLLVLLLALSGSTSAQSSLVPEIPFRSVPDFLKLPPDMYLGEVSGVAVNSKGHVFVFHRAATPPARPMRRPPRSCWSSVPTANSCARSATISTPGRSRTPSRSIKDDNIWVTDKGSDMVIKFNPEGRVVMVFGRKQEASDEGTEPLKHPKPPLPPVDGMFRQVTDMAWDAAGNTYISDGYINSRVAKVDKDGNWLKSWGEPGDQPGQFNTPHSIATDAQGQHLRRRPRQSPHPGVRRRRQVPAPDHHRRARSCPTLARPSATSPAPTSPEPWRPARPGRSASRLRRIKCCTAPTPIPAASTSSAWTARCWACSGNAGKQLEAVRLDSRNGLPVRERTLSSANC